MAKTHPIHRTCVAGPSGDIQQEETHPAFGLIQFNRVTGRPSKLFGSHINNHAGFIRMTIRKARRIHALHRDFYMPKDCLFEVDLTHAQFAELITSMNVGSGTPCTLRFERAHGGKIPNIPEELETEQDKITSSFEAALEELKGKIYVRTKAIEAVMDKKSIGKKDRENVRKALQNIYMQVSSNIPFILDQLTDSADKVTQHAKTEIDGFMTSVIRSAGLEALQNNLAPAITGIDLPQLEDENV